MSRPPPSTSTLTRGHSIYEIWECQSGKRDGHDPISDRELIGELAHSFIGSAFPSLTWDNIIPPPTHHPFIDVGRDYAGSDVSGPEFAALEEALNASYPNRFSEPLTKPHPEFSNMYIFSFLEGCVVRCADAGDNIFEGDTQPVQVSVDELLGVLDASEYTMTCCRAASQVTPATGTPVTIGDVTLYPDSGASDDLLQRAVDLIPAGPSALNREIPRFYDPPSSLIVTSTTTDDGDIYGVARTLAGRIDRFLLLARLLFAGTHQSCWQLIGASTLISRVSPMYRRFEKAAIPDIRMQRVVRLQESDAPAFAALGALLDDAVIKREGMVATSFDIALLNYNRSHEEGDDFERVIDLATALEAILTGSESDTEAVGHRLRTRASALLWTDDDPGLAIYRDVSALYGLRSRLVHGERIKESDLRKWIYSVSTVADDAPFGVAVAFAVDRLRDLVRRSFLARLCLASGMEPLWPFEGSTAVDAALADNQKQHHWREIWRSGRHPSQDRIGPWMRRHRGPTLFAPTPSSVRHNPLQPGSFPLGVSVVNCPSETVGSGMAGATAARGNLAVGGGSMAHHRGLFVRGYDSRATRVRRGRPLCSPATPAECSSASALPELFVAGGSPSPKGFPPKILQLDQRRRLLLSLTRLAKPRPGLNGTTGRYWRRRRPSREIRSR